MNHLLKFITAAGVVLSVALTGCQDQTETTSAPKKNEEVKE